MNDKWYLDGRLGVKVCDITSLEIDAIVNAANSSLMGGGGVDGAIHKAGGPSILEACRKIRTDRFPEGLQAGQAVMTKAGDLPCHFVIHTVGPVWQGGGADEEDLLAKAYRESLQRARESNLKDVAFPAISTGVYGFPKERAAVIAFHSVSQFLENHIVPQKVMHVFFRSSDAQIFLQSNGLT